LQGGKKIEWKNEKFETGGKSGFSQSGERKKKSGKQ
jgi:hypothetical protein